MEWVSAMFVDFFTPLASLWIRNVWYAWNLIPHYPQTKPRNAQKDNVPPKIEQVRFNGTRLCCVIIFASYLSSPILITSVYLPTDMLYDKNDSGEHSFILSEITSLSNDLNISSIVIGEDF